MIFVEVKTEVIMKVFPEIGNWYPFHISPKAEVVIVGRCFGLTKEGKISVRFARPIPYLEILPEDVIRFVIAPDVTDLI
ncbi:MAG: hypothetical protein AAB451_03320 [Patescibacteria group bacterium]